MSQMSPVGGSALETFLPKLTVMGLIAYAVGLLMDAISNIVIIGAWGATLGTVLWLISGIIELGIGGLLLIRAKYILLARGSFMEVLTTDPTLRIIVYLVPTYVLLRGIGFLQGAIVTGIGLIGAGALIFALIIINFAKMMTPSTAVLTNFILAMLLGAFFGIAGFSMAESSLPNTLLMYSGILGIAIIVVGLGFLVANLSPATTTIREVMTHLSYLLGSMALLIGGALAIRDGIEIIRIGTGAVVATGATYLIAGILGGVLAGVLSIVIIIVSFMKMLSKAAEALPPPPPPPPPPPQ